MERTVDVVVVGAGVVGSACAYHLADAGLKVALLEREAIASGVSPNGTGSLSLCASDFVNEAHLRLGAESYRLTRELVPRLQDLTGADILYQLRPAMRLALEEAEEDLIHSQLTWHSGILEVEWIDAEDVRRIEPRLNPEIRGAAYQDESAHLDSGRYTMALATAAERRGAEIVLRQVTGLLRDGDRVTGVRYRGGQLSSAAVVLAMGPWAPLASDWLGFDVPVRPLRGERVQLDTDEPPLAALLSSPKRGHMISRLDGYLSVGSLAGRDLDDQGSYLIDQTGEYGFDVKPTTDGLMELLQRAIDVFPAVENAQVSLQVAGVRPLSPDRKPLIGPVPGCPGAFLATGHGTKGIHLAAATGRLIADLVTRGGTDLPLSLEEFSPARFHDRTPDFGAAPESVED